MWPLQTSPVSMFPKFTTVFGVPVFAASSVSVKAIFYIPPHNKLVSTDAQDAEFQHGASVLAEWLDNDEDGCVDTPEVLLAAILIFIRSL